MPTDRRNPEPLNASELDEIVNGTQPTAAEIALEEAHRAVDHAVMALFELAFSLESLGDAIGCLNGETDATATA